MIKTESSALLTPKGSSITQKSRQSFESGATPCTKQLSATGKTLRWLSRKATPWQVHSSASVTFARRRFVGTTAARFSGQDHQCYLAMIVGKRLAQDGGKVNLMLLGTFIPTKAIAYSEMILLVDRFITNRRGSTYDRS